MKIVKGLFGAIKVEEGYVKELLNGITFKGSDKLWSLIFITMYLVCEIIPVLIALDTFMIKIFTLEVRSESSYIEIDEDSMTVSHVTQSRDAPDMRNDEMNYSRRLNDEESKDQGNSVFKGGNDDGATSSMTDNQDMSFENIPPPDFSKNRQRNISHKRKIRKIKEIIVDDPNDFELKGEFEIKRVNKPKKKFDKPFGKLYDATLKGEDVVCRRVDFERLTTYMIEDLNEELQITSSICSLDNIVKIKAFYVDKKHVYLFYPKLVSLYEFIHIKQNDLNQQEKLDISIKL